MSRGTVKKQTLILCFMVFLFLVMLVISIGFGSVGISLHGWVRMLIKNEMTMERTILLYVRLPRVIGGIFAGAALASAGMILQSVLHNPMASPNIIGVNAGAGFFVTLSITVMPTVVQMLPIMAFVGALTALLLIYSIARKVQASKTTLILAGIAINSILNAGTDMIHVLNPNAVLGTMEFRVGGLNSISGKILLPACIMIVIALLVLFTLRTEIEVLTLGDEMATSLGLQTKHIRLVALILAAVLAGSAVSFSGLLGFVGLIVPHCVRSLLGSHPSYMLPGCIFMGAICVLFSDLLARVVVRPYELPTGIILSVIGAPFFLYLLLSNKRGIRHD